jgi:hypothetical protein
MSAITSYTREVATWRCVLFCWRVSLIKGTPAKFLGDVHAADEKAAIARAAEDYDVDSSINSRRSTRRHAGRRMIPSGPVDFTPLRC